VHNLELACAVSSKSSRISRQQDVTTVTRISTEPGECSVFCRKLVFGPRVVSAAPPAARSVRFYGRHLGGPRSRQTTLSPGVSGQHKRPGKNTDSEK
jgi:hypothetical protein